jgi:hypothetical protein
MPQFRPDDVATPDHAYLMNNVKPQGGGSGTRFFMEPVRAFLSYLQTNSDSDGFPRCTDYHMTGISGGGWTTTVYAAIDPTIELSFPVAGSIPLYLRCPTGGAATYSHDAEQFQGNGIYHIAGYQDLYILGAAGTNSNGFPRHQTQILDREDDCCFGQAEQAASLGPWDASVNHYELAVRNALYDIGQGGMFRDRGGHPHPDRGRARRRLRRRRRCAAVQRRRPKPRGRADHRLDLPALGRVDVSSASGAAEQ